MQPEVLEDFTTEPISLETAKRWLVVNADFLDEDENITSCLQAAREYCESRTGECFGIKTLKVEVPYTSTGYKNLPGGPLVEVLEVVNPGGITIVSDAGLGSTWLAEYLKGMSINNTYKEDYFGFGLYNPLEYLENLTYTVTYKAGYAPGKLPHCYIMAMKKLITDFYENRENIVVGMSVTAHVSVDVDKLLATRQTKVLFA